MSIHLKYWNGRGLMEVPRLLLAAAGKFPGDYTDGRYNETPQDSNANLGRMPLLQLGEGESLGQSAAINYYVAAEHGLLGSNNWEAAQIIAIYEHTKELNAAYRALVPWGTEPSAETLNKWFDEGANDTTGPAAQGDSRSARFLTWWAGRIESSLPGKNGFAVGDKLSLADVLLYYIFADYLRENEAAADAPAWRREPFGSKARTDAKLDAHPKIKASVQAVLNNANIQKWLATRGPQGF